jgi:hypothetical protein
MNFARLRSKYNGPINKIAYIGMMGDILVIGALYLYWRQRKANKEAARLANYEAEIQRNL